jgi:molecular chaperone GrpE
MEWLDKMKNKSIKGNADKADIIEDPEEIMPDEIQGDEKKIEYLLSRIQEKEKEASEYYDKYLRAVAELENYKKRSAKEKSETLRYGQENLIRDILPLVDNLDRALAHAGNSDASDAFKKGLKLVQEQLLVCLEKYGVEKIDACGKDFDPYLHEAVLQVESEEHEDNKVVDEIEPGYLLNGRLLRPAKVSVSKHTKRQDRHEDEGK